ncbi:hypothetical protein L1987_08975 [Smallanthus sonchifolius]|uniref:Uncharacterized protein n=1 Tax=Smallanthus sonchifolius TaxID=185202 RepID=A0ACB9JLN6_9ASTR|nr:hypothetical protein L1987_08975 [Smallanthus sonchifolius]
MYVLASPYGGLCGWLTVVQLVEDGVTTVTHGITGIPMEGTIPCGEILPMGFYQQEGLDYTEVYAPVTRIEAIRLFLTYATYVGFKVYQLDVKSAFLYGKVHEEVYVTQPLGFEDPHNINKVYKLDKALYGLHQAPQAWYETLSKHLLSNGFDRGQIDSTLFIRKTRGDILLVQINPINLKNSLKHFKENTKPPCDPNSLNQAAESRYSILPKAPRLSGLAGIAAEDAGSHSRRRRNSFLSNAIHPSSFREKLEMMQWVMTLLLPLLAYLKGYNFPRYIFKAINDKINTAERFRFLLYPRFVQLLIDDALPNLPATGERLQVKRVDKRVFAQFLKPGCVEPTPKHTTLFGHLINEAYVAPADWRRYSHDLEPELSEHSDEQQQQEEEEVESVDGSSKNGDEEEGHDGAEGSDSEETESDSSDSDDAPSQAHPRRTTKRRRHESVNKKRGDRQQLAIPSEVEVTTLQQVQVPAACTDSASTPPSQQLYRRQRRRPHVQPEVAVTSITEEVPVIVTLPVTSVQVAVITPILTESVTITPSITPTTVITSSIPTTTIEPISQPFNYEEFTQGFDFDTTFSSPIHNAKASTSRNPDPNEERIVILETQVASLLETIQKSKEESDAQQAQINSLVEEVRILRSQRTGTDERPKNIMAQNKLLIKTNNMFLGHRSSLELRFDMQKKEHELMVKLITDLTKKLDAQGGKDKEKEKEKTTTCDEACHPVDLTKDDDKDKDPEVGPSGSEHQALAIVPISAIPKVEGESTHQEGGNTSGGGGDKGKSAADVLKDLSDDEILYLEPDYSKEAQIDALYNLEEGEIDSGDDWDEDDEDVVIEVLKGDGEGEYELEDGEIFEVPSFEAQLDTGSVEHASNVDASTEASPVDPTPVDPEAPKEKDMPSTSSKGPTPVW